MKNELMIDIETTGKDPGCKVLTIGAFGFDRDGNQCEFYRRFDILKLVEEGFQDDLSTMDWWRKKDKEVFDEAFGGKDDPKEGIAEFNKVDFMHLTRKGHADLAAKLAQIVPTLV